MKRLHEQALFKLVHQIRPDAPKLYHTSLTAISRLVSLTIPESPQSMALIDVKTWAPTPEKESSTQRGPGHPVLRRSLLFIPPIGQRMFETLVFVIFFANVLVFSHPWAALFAAGSIAALRYAISVFLCANNGGISSLSRMILVIDSRGTAS